MWCTREKYQENRYKTPFLGKETCVGCMKDDSLYNLLPDQAPDISDVFHSKNSCAVVTYSKCLYHHSYGSVIDSHDVVLRFNFHTYENATAHGTKTTHMMTTYLAMQSSPKELKRFPHVLIYNTLISDWNCSFSSKQRQFVVNTLSLRKETIILDPLFIQSSLVASQFYKRRYRVKASTGWTGMYLMTRFCSVINAYGFCPDIQEDYGTSPDHRFSAEHEKYLEWSRRTDLPFKLKMFP